MTGRLLNQDALSVQLITPKDELKSYSKAGLRDYTLVLKGLMPSVQGKLPDAAVWTKLSKEAVARVNTEAELLTGVQRSEGYQRAFETIVFNKGEIKAELDKWNKDVQEALSGL